MKIKQKKKNSISYLHFFFLRNSLVNKIKATFQKANKADFFYLIACLSDRSNIVEYIFFL